MIFKLKNITNQEELKRVDYRLPAIVTNHSITCDNMGVNGTTDIWVRIRKSTIEGYDWKFELRMGIALFGSCYQPDEEAEHPFEDGWWDNYVQGKGYTLEAAFKQFKSRYEEIGNSLWY